MRPIPFDRLFKLTDGGVLLAVKVSPKSHKDAVKGIVDLPHGRIGLAIRVSPPAADGAANEAVISLLAQLFKVSRSCVEIKSGAISRIKTVGIHGNHLALRTTLIGSLEAHSRS